MTRAVHEWVGKTPDSAIPPRVRVRVFDRFEGVCQCGCTRHIHPGIAWHTDHKVALVNGGEHRESNLVPILVECHKIKTRADVALKALSYRKRTGHIGIKKPRTITRWRKMNGDIVIAPRQR